MLIFLFLQLGLSFSSEKYNVCSITINSDDEVKAFKKHLNPKDFNFVELTDHIDPAAKAKGNVPSDWFDQVCERDIRCDVLLVSGHFGGDFFGSSGISLPLETLEQASCQHKCQNILNSAQEVFLFGCNTLATKEQDHRTPAQYVDVLVEDGIDRTQAERIAQARYGALGSSFKDRMQRVFESVPNIYGFDSVGPSGKTIRPFLDKYFAGVGDYKQHLLKLQTKGIVDILGKASNINQNLHNPELAKALANTAYAECRGISPDDPAYRIKKEICKFYDEDLSMDNKVALAEALLSTDDALLYIPTIAAYFSKNSSDGLKKLKNNDKIKNLLNELATQLESSPGVYIDMLNLQLGIGFIDEKQWISKVKDVMRPYVRKMDRASADIICSVMEPDSNPDMEERIKKISFAASEMDLSQLSKKDGLNAMTCLNVSPESVETVSKELLKLKDQRRGEEHQAYYLAAALQQTTNEDLKVIIPFAKAELVKMKNSDFRVGIQIFLIEAYGKVKDMKGLEALYQTGNMYAGGDYDTRWMMIAEAAKMESHSSFYEDKALEHIRKVSAHQDSDGYYAASQMLGAVRDTEKAKQVVNILGKQKNEDLENFLLNAFSVVDGEARPKIPEAVVGLFIERVIKNRDSYRVYSSDNILPYMTEAQIADLKQFMNTTDSMHLKTKIQDILNNTNH